MIILLELMTKECKEESRLFKEIEKNSESWRRIWAEKTKGRQTNVTQPCFIFIKQKVKKKFLTALRKRKEMLYKIVQLT